MNSVNIRSAKEEERKDILGLLDTVFAENQRSHTQRGDKFWEWKYKNDLFGKSILTVAEDNNELVGIDHLWPWEFKSRGEILKAFQPCDSVVLPEYRGQGVFQRMRIKGIEKAKNRDCEFLFNFPNENSLSTNIKLGASYFGKIEWWVKILKPVSLALGFFSNELSSVLAIDREYNLDASKLDQIASEYVAFDKYLIINRKTGFHDWRYKQKPNREYGMVTLEKKSKKIAAVFTMNQKGLNREMVVVDIIGNPDLFDEIMSKLLTTARELDATFLALMRNIMFGTDQLWKRGFIKKRLKNMVVLPLDVSLESKIANIENWSLVAGMHDSI